MKLFFGAVVWVIFCIWMGMLFYGCAGTGKREAWEYCSGINHQECIDMYYHNQYCQHEDYLDCEYEFYKECIGE